MSSDQSTPVPNHVALIMDGNGRWAKAQGKKRLQGHEQGVESVQACVKAALAHGVSYLTFYAFSEQNWNRPKLEILGLMSLLEKFIKEVSGRLDEEEIRLIVIGRRQKLPSAIQKELAKLEAKSAKNTKLVVQLALSYGSREEIIDAVKLMADKVAQGTLSSDEIDEETVSQHLYTREVPDPDLLIRTSGEMRLSNFLLWQLSYAELYVTETLWPDFREESFKAALEAFAKRSRRYGKVEED